ncbi:MAG: hypothetical protein ACOYNZ_19575 [Rhodoferax sp.]
MTRPDPLRHYAADAQAAGCHALGAPAGGDTCAADRLLWRQHRSDGGEEVLRLNRAAYAGMRCSKELSVIPGATHLFEEHGTLEQVASQATAWFSRYLQA